MESIEDDGYDIRYDLSERRSSDEFDCEQISKKLKKEFS